MVLIICFLYLFPKPTKPHSLSKRGVKRWNRAAGINDGFMFFVWLYVFILC